jgi:FAD/FMN-containing dehydrogenase
MPQSPATAILLDDLRAALGAAHVLTGAEARPYGRDWTGQYSAEPLAVLRPGSTREVSRALALAHAAGAAVVPAGGRTGLSGAAHAPGQLMLSLERMNRVRGVNAASRIVTAEAGAILSTLHEAAAAESLHFPLWFGARGSATLGGALSTNAGGSNVLRYGSTRGLCLGIEAVLADGRVLDLMGELHKDNTGYALKDLFIGAEGTLGVITAAVMRLVPAPRAHATATVACPGLGAALDLLNRLQAATGGLVEAFEYMPRSYMQRLALVRPDLGQPFATVPDCTILVELGATAPRDCDPGPDGAVPLRALLEGTLATMFEAGLVGDAIVAGSEAQRRAMWARREAAAEITVGRLPIVDSDVAVPLDRVGDFLDAIAARLAVLDPGAETITVAHLGDGNLHFSVWPSHGAPDHLDAVRTAVEDVVAALRGSFSAEHGIGLSKLGTMARRKDRVALDVMRAVKAALDPAGILNPGKVVP